MSEYFIITNAPSANLSHAELSEMQKAGKVRAYGPYNAEAMLKYFADGKIKGNTVVYEKSAPFTQAFSDIYPSLRAGGVDFGTPVQINNDNFRFEIEQNTRSVPQKNRPVQRQAGNSNYITSSWRGEKGLAVSYWVNGFLLTFVLQIIIGIYSSAASLFPYVARSNVRTYYTIALLFEILAITIAAWQTVGIWRSADNHKNLTGKKFYAVLAQGVMVITAIGLFVKIGTLGSYYNDVFWNALGKDPLGGYNLQVSNDGTTLTVSGVISFGLASDVDKTLAANPGIKTVVLNSEGGRVWEGENLYDVLNNRNIYETRTETGCSSACTIPFMAGEVRTIKDDQPLLGFHSSSSLYYTKTSVDADNRRWQTFLVSNGVSSEFTRKALGTPPSDMWYPSIKTLTNEGIVNSVSGNIYTTNTTSSYDVNRLTQQRSEDNSSYILEKMDAAGYTYMLVSEGNGTRWIAAPSTAVNIGDRIYIPEGMPMPGYESKTLGRKFDMVHFVPYISYDKNFMKSQNTGTQQVSQSTPPANINLAGLKKADVTIGELYANRKSMHGHRVSIRGKVIKFSPELLGKNWLRLQDGTGQDGSNDLTVTTQKKVKVGDTIVATGNIYVDKNFGYGYIYDVMMEDAEIIRE